MEENGRISSNDLMYKLAQSKKIMEKVDNKDYQTGNINSEILRSDPEELLSEVAGMTPKPSVRIPQNNNVDVNRIQNTKLPDAIKKAMIEKPISQISPISLNDGIDLSILKGAKRLMEQESGVSKAAPKTTPVRQTTVINENVDLNSIQVMIENTIRKVLDEKLTQILTAQESTSINESLAIKVGGTVFTGKLTKVNKNK